MSPMDQTKKPWLVVEKYYAPLVLLWGAYLSINCGPPEHLIDVKLKTLKSIQSFYIYFDTQVYMCFPILIITLVSITISRRNLAPINGKLATILILCKLISVF